MLWCEHLINAKEVESKFPAGGVSLTGLFLLRLEYLPGNKLMLNFFQQEIPPVIPDRWRSKKITALELRFSLGISSMEFGLQEEFVTMPSLSVFLEKMRFRVESEADSSILLVANTFFIELEVRPLESIPT